MNCEQYQEQISQFIDGELLQRAETELFVHLGVCEHCRTFLKNALALRNTLTIARQVTVPPSLDQRVLNLLKQPIPQNLFWRKRETHYSFRALGLAVIFSVLTGILVSSLWYTFQQPQRTIVCLTPLPEVEVNGYVVIGHPPIKGHQQ